MISYYERMLNTGWRERNILKWLRNLVSDKNEDDK